MEEGETKAIFKTAASVGDCGPTTSNEDRNPYTNISSPYKNGISRLELLMSMTGDLNRNIPVPTDTFDDKDNNRASQLLRAAAAASVVTNGFTSNGLRSFLPENASRQDLPVSKSRNDDLSKQLSATTSSVTSGGDTVVSFSSKPTMSTGFPPATLVKSTLSDLPLTCPTETYADTKLVSHLNAVSRKTPAVAVTLPPSDAVSRKHAVVVPFLWKREHIEGVIIYRRYVAKHFTSLVGLMFAVVSQN